MTIIIYYIDGNDATYRDIEKIKKDPFGYYYTLTHCSGLEIKIPMNRVNRISTTKEITHV